MGISKKVTREALEHPCASIAKAPLYHKDTAQNAVTNDKRMFIQRVRSKKHFAKSQYPQNQTRRLEHSSHHLCKF